MFAEIQAWASAVNSQSYISQKMGDGDGTWSRGHFITKVFVRGKGIDRAGPVVLIDLIQPRHAPGMVFWPGLPVLALHSEKWGRQPLTHSHTQTH